MPSRSVLVAEAGFAEVADRVWVARHAWLDVNVTVVAGARGLAVIDTLTSEAAARAMVEDLRGLTGQQVVAVVNTHEHWDHTFGNAALRDAWPDLELHAHEEAAARTLASGRRTQESYDGPHAEEVRATRLVAAERTFSGVGVVDLDDRVLELVHPGRGHTGGDLVVRIADCDVLLAGDLVEESAAPSYGPDCFPLEWPGALDTVVGLLTPGSVVVPGHGSLVDVSFVQEQRGDVGVVAETIFDLASRMVPVQQAMIDALRDVGLPFPPGGLEHAVRRGYEQVPLTSRRLPLV